MATTSIRRRSRPRTARTALDYTRRLGDRLATEGYRGQLEVDYLVDAGSGDLYLGEINPRLSGISSMTNVSASAYADMPLFLFHLAEYLDLDYVIDTDDLRRRWASDHLTDIWGQIVLKELDDGIELLHDAPQTGIWRLHDDGSIRFLRAGLDWHSLGDESEGFWLRILGPGDYRYHGADLGMLVTRARMQSRRRPPDRLCTGVDQGDPRALRRHAAERRRTAAAGLRSARLQGRVDSQDDDRRDRQPGRDPGRRRRAPGRHRGAPDRARRRADAARRRAARPARDARRVRRHSGCRRGCSRWTPSRSPSTRSRLRSAGT